MDQQRRGKSNTRKRSNEEASSSQLSDEQLARFTVSMRASSNVNDSGEGSSMIDQNNGTQSPQNGSLPFTKNSSMWGVLESVKVFKTMGKLPHFRPLEHFSEEIREELALGHMHNFLDLVHEIQKATLEQTRSMFEVQLDALANFEAMGFDVQRISSRVQELLRLKDTYYELNETSELVQKDGVEIMNELKELQGTIGELRVKHQRLDLEKKMTRSNLEVLIREKMLSLT